MGYENYRFLEPYRAIQPLPTAMPGYWFGFFEAVLVLDHARQRAFLTSATLSASGLQPHLAAWLDLFEKAPAPGLARDSRAVLKRKPHSADFTRSVRRIQEYLKAGDAYQVNLTDWFEAQSDASAGAIYTRLRENSPAPYSAFLNAGDFQVLSASPECFLEVKGDRIATFPIKGTRKRHSDPDQDAELKADLLRSPKDHAELLMIVDLERHDLGRICEFGSVTANSEFSIQSFAQVHHRVAEVKGTLKKGIGALEALKALFPGGSVTGAPKKRAMEIIRELELRPRSVYTGALGFLGADGSAQFNLPIRTITRRQEEIIFYAGCGITADSVPEDEFDELLTKASGMMKAIGL